MALQAQRERTRRRRWSRRFILAVVSPNTSASHSGNKYFVDRLVAGQIDGFVRFYAEDRPCRPHGGVLWPAVFIARGARGRPGVSARVW